MATTMPKMKMKDENEARKRQLSAESDLDKWLISLAKCTRLNSADGQAYYVSYICGYSRLRGPYGPEVGVYADSNCKEYIENIDFFDFAAANGVSIDESDISAYISRAFQTCIDCSKEENANACAELIYASADFDTCEAVIDGNADAAQDAEEGQDQDQDQDQENAQANSESIEEACVTFRELEESGNLVNGIFSGTKHAGSYPLTGGAIAGIAIAAVAAVAAIAATVATYRRKAASVAIKGEDLLPEDKEDGEKFDPYSLDNIRTFAIQKYLANRINKKKEDDEASTYKAPEVSRSVLCSYTN